MSKRNTDWRKAKWRNIPLSSDNIDEYLEDLYSTTKGQYITQAVSFNKDDSLQMGLLRNALLEHSSFSGLIKFLLQKHFSVQEAQAQHFQHQSIYNTPSNVRTNSWSPSASAQQSLLEQEEEKKQTNPTYVAPHVDSTPHEVFKEEKSDKEDDGKQERKPVVSNRQQKTTPPPTRRKNMSALLKANPNGVDS